MARLLSIDDDRSVHHLVSRTLEDSGVEVVPALSAEAGIEAVKAQAPDVVLLDIMLPDMSGLDAFRLIRQHDPRLPVIIATSAGSSENAIEAMKLGAFDYLTKPIDVENLERLVGHAIESRRLASVPVGMNNLTRPQDRGDAFVGRCESMQEIFKSIGRVAPQSVPVLIRGESGTGKELVARAIYQHGSRSDGPFLAVNCAALSETLLESELFGHEKGAFTGAQDRRIGKFEQCNGGTIFLDEVGDMSPTVQSKVLRLLQQQTFERVGGNSTIKTDVRIISATNRDLEEMCDEGQFRVDLFYRLNGYTITLPPLRERGDDRVMLLQHFLAGLNKELNRDVQGVAPDAMQKLLDYDWPGNVRELQSVVKQAMLHCSGPVLMASALPAELQSAAVRPRAEASQPSTNGMAEKAGAAAHASSEDEAEDFAESGFRDFIRSRIAVGTGDLYAETLAEMEKELLTLVLTHTSGNQSEASRILGITRGSLRNKIRSNGIVIGPNIKVAQ
ncbi:Nitrogen assimilation regulatory protein [Posidoniimonas polymericola]|uniref:DNA-binding transcriptional regulator NtrC n=1 Tax=Posidoniimonas polymericola TaxID=2528002 RepID=A0A5C5XW77_9BACT|nr:sigma-54 dependent transcriptional regulator [Posidoniimonas polymericola]TWT66729.1 Nitrogen assimilation regulatory protein [Posidoniimonas polymericola]